LIERHDPGKLSRYTLTLANEGAVTMKDLSIVRVEGSPALQLERVGIEANEWTVKDIDHPTPPPMRRLAGYRLDSGSSNEITLELRQGRLCPAGVARLDAVWVGYEVFGTRQEQRIALDESPGVRCP
jgi:hypothetical protein